MENYIPPKILNILHSALFPYGRAKTTVLLCSQTRPLGQVVLVPDTANRDTWAAEAIPYPDYTAQSDGGSTGILSSTTMDHAEPRSNTTRQISVHVP